jgi:hypothetical protein
MYHVENIMKAQFVIDLLKSNGNRFTPDELEAATGTARRARRALFLARRDFGIKLDAIRDAGRAVTAYVFADSVLPTVAAATPKASKGSAKAKVAKAPKAPKLRGSTSDEDTEYFAAMADQKAKLEKSVRAINTAYTAKVPKVKSVDVSRISDEAKAAIKAKNLETLKAVSATTKGRLHPVTKRQLTDEQATVLDEFAALEKQAELEEIRAEEQAALRANAPSFLFKESYSE